MVSPAHSKPFLPAVLAACPQPQDSPFRGRDFYASHDPTIGEAVSPSSPAKHGSTAIPSKDSSTLNTSADEPHIGNPLPTRYTPPLPQRPPRPHRFTYTQPS
jgi:hypothetical protein